MTAGTYPPRTIARRHSAHLFLEERYEKVHGAERLLAQVLGRVEERAHHLGHFLGEDSLDLGLNVTENREEG